MKKGMSCKIGSGNNESEKNMKQKCKNACLSSKITTCNLTESFKKVFHSLIFIPFMYEYKKIFILLQRDVNI